MKILLTGATGFTGVFFHQRALAAGHTVIPLNCDLTDKAAVAGCLFGLQFDAVVHLAAISFVRHADERAFYNTNIIGTQHLLDALAELAERPQSVLLASSANVYGNSRSSPIEESEAPNPVNHYAISKLGMEYMARNYLNRLPIIFTRPFNYTGPGQASAFLIPKLIDHFARQTPWIELGNLHVEREFNDVRMVCDAYLSLLHTGTPGEIYNICSGKAHSLQTVIDLLQKKTGHYIEVKINPAYVRTNEVTHLCGDPTKLLACTGSLQSYDLSCTLNWMLSVARQGM